MKRSQLLAATIVALMVFALVPALSAQAAPSYTEKLNVYVAGSDALWFFTFGGVNKSSGLNGFESASGLSGYNITAIKTTSWSSDFQVFGSRGYDLLPVPFLPSQGLFLTVASDSFPDAALAAKALDPYFLTSFRSLSNGTDTFSFYSPISFDSLVPSTLLSMLPTSEGGFSKAITTSAFLSESSPFIVLEGRKSGSSFDRSLVVGSITSKALSATSQPDIMSYFGGSTTYLKAANNSASTVVQLNFLDGVVVSTDKSANVTSDSAKFSGSYTLKLAHGEKLSAINATVAQQPAPLLAYRTVVKGVLNSGDKLTVALIFKDPYSTEAVSNITFSDNWWSKTGYFKLQSGVYSIANQSVGAGTTFTPSYTLEYNGTATGSVTIPASVVRYQYTYRGATFGATAVLNPIRLSLGMDDAVIYSTATAVGGFDKGTGDVQKFNITVANVGTQPASTVVVAGHPLVGLVNGFTQTVTVSKSALGMLGTNVTQSFTTTYLDTAGTNFTVSSNVVSDAFSHTSMVIGSPALTVSPEISSLAGSRTNLTLAFATSNQGPGNVTSFKASGTLPPGMGCGRVIGKGISCASGVVTISYPALNKSSTVSDYMIYNLSASASTNFIVAPFTFDGTDSLGTLSGRSNAAAVPTGVILSKQFAPAQLFGGMDSSAAVSATNAGPLPVYNMTVSSTIDSFDAAKGTPALSNKTANMASGDTLEVHNNVILQQVSGNQTATPATASFYFGGTSFTLTGAPPTLQVYQPLRVSITTAPTTPEEGKNFTISMTINNPTSVQVSDVNLTIPVPSGLTLSDLVNAQVTRGVLTVTTGTLGPHGNLTATVRAVASSGITIPFQDATLTFSYAGVTINGIVPKSTGIAIAEDVTTRYIIPTAFILIATLAVAVYVRKKAATAHASQK